jgi:hypothetical protein
VATRAEEAIRKLISQKPPVKGFTLEQMLKLNASSELIFLLQAYFLTVGKIFRMNRNGSETATIEYSKLQGKLSKKVPIDLLKKTVDFCQMKLAEASVIFVQHQSKFVDIDLSQTKMVLPPPKLGSLKRPCTRAFYNFKAILLRLEQEKALILVKQYAFKGVAKTVGIFYRGFKPEDAERIKPDEPVFVIEGFFVELPLHPFIQKVVLREYIEDIGLMNLALMNAAQVPQFSSTDETNREIEEYRTKGKELGISLKEPGAFTIVHTHAGLSKDEQGRLLCDNQKP